jgi:hypothetical protein
MKSIIDDDKLFISDMHNDNYADVYVKDNSFLGYQIDFLGVDYQIEDSNVIFTSTSEEPLHLHTLNTPTSIDDKDISSDVGSEKSPYSGNLISLLK